VALLLRLHDVTGTATLANDAPAQAPVEPGEE
jgi:hypothetical protein